MTPADVILIFVIILSIGGVLYYHYADKRQDDAKPMNAE